MLENNLPMHVAIIPDGNRRWAARQGLPRWKGHREGVTRFVEVANATFAEGVPFFTFWAASADNLIKRNKTEVRALTGLFRKQLKQGLEPFEKKDIRLRIIGRGEEIIGDRGLSEDIRIFEKSSAENGKYNLTIAFGYDGTEELVGAVRETSANAVWSSQHPYSASADKTCIQDAGLIDEAVITSNLWTKDLPSVDLLIRTGEMDHEWAHNSSGFMMLLTANSELYFPRLFWPEFTKEEFRKALEGYAQRQRRLGG